MPRSKLTPHASDGGLNGVADQKKLLLVAGKAFGSIIGPVDCE
jgi:hypothetical protein